MGHSSGLDTHRVNRIHCGGERIRNSAFETATGHLSEQLTLDTGIRCFLIDLFLFLLHVEDLVRQ